MAGAIKTGPVTKAYEDGWERTFAAPGREFLEDVARHVDEVVSAPNAFQRRARRGFEEHVECAYCGRTDLKAGQECACTARAPGPAAWCAACGLALTAPGATRCQRHGG